MNDSYIFNFVCQNKKSKIEIFKCKDYKSNFFFPAYIHLNGDNIVKANNEHNHNIDHQKILLEEAKGALKNEIKDSVNPFSINLQKSVKSFSVDKGIQAPSFTKMKNTLYKQINTILPGDIENLALAPDDSIYYKTLKDEKFVIYKDADLMIMQSPNLAKIQMKLGNIIFCNATFYICPTICYQVFITRVYSNKTNSYYTTSFSIMNTKREKGYYKIFKILDDNIKNYLDFGESYNVKEIHIDFEYAIANGCKKVYPGIKIKYCVWHFMRALN